MSFFNNNLPKPEILAVRTAARTRIFEIQAVDLRFHNGQLRTYERLTPSIKPAVMVLAVHEGQLVMIREYAVASERYELTFVKGLINAGETPEQAARRELQEEIGYTAAKITPMRMLYNAPGHMFSPMHTFLAQDLSSSRLQGDEPEPLVPVLVPLDKVPELIDDVALGDARVLSALMLFERYFLPSLLQAA